jgi:hypothetical protein
VRGRGRGEHGRRRGGRVANENTTENVSSIDPDVHQVKLLSAASRRRIDALNKQVYPPDSAPVVPLGASHSTNLDGMYPAITFNAPPLAAASKKRTRDPVSEGDIVSGKRARKERVRMD